LGHHDALARGEPVGFHDDGGGPGAKVRNGAVRFVKERGIYYGVRGSAAAFRLLILDSCRSGALTRVKGGTPIPPFDIQLNEKMAGEGAVFLTSSSASEDSQESDELKGSFFTHALLSGLLGAADENGDGKVTLDEAYRHAYEATLRASSRTLAGTQHPTFQYDLRGTGDLVLASLDARSPTRAWLELPAGKTWLVFQENADGAVVGEVSSADQAKTFETREAAEAHRRTLKHRYYWVAITVPK